MAVKRQSQSRTILVMLVNERKHPLLRDQSEQKRIYTKGNNYNIVVVAFKLFLRFLCLPPNSKTFSVNIEMDFMLTFSLGEGASVILRSIESLQFGEGHLNRLQ